MFLPLSRLVTIVFLVVSALALTTLSSERLLAQERTLTVYTYESFAADGGLGAALRPLYEERCGCSLEFRTFEDAGTLLNTLKIERNQSTADLVVGLDNNMSAEAKRFFRPHGLGRNYNRLFDLPVPWIDSTFVPFDFGWFAFVYDKTKVLSPPQSFAELLASPLRLVIQDPRTSSPGLGLLLWIRKVYGNNAAEAWKALFPKVVTTTKGWSEAYGLFLQGEADMVLSYTTSPAYHAIVENDNNYRAALFAEGQFVQIELAAIAKTTKHPALAKDFLRFLVSPAAQNLVATHNWMFPILGKDQNVLPPDIFENIRRRMANVPTLSMPSGTVLQNRRAWIAEWRNAGF